MFVFDVLVVVVGEFDCYVFVVEDFCLVLDDIDFVFF